MFIAAYLINGIWNDQFTTNRPTKDLRAMCEGASEVEGCTLCGILNAVTRELMCYATPAAKN